MASSTTRVFIIVRAPNGDVREVPVGQTAVVIGRDESADIRVEDKKVSRRHASFKLIDGEPWVEDLGSANGVKLNGKRINKRAKIGPQDKVKVGGYQVTLRDQSFDSTGASEADEQDAEKQDGRGTSIRAPSGQEISREEVTPNRTQGVGAVSLKMKKGPQLPDDGKSPVLSALDDPVKGERFVLHSGENIIGRLEECDIPVLDGSVSRQHARVVYARDRISISDLGSSNGTFVNDVRVEMAELANGDSLRVGNIRFNVELPPELSKSVSSAPVRTRSKQKKSEAESRPWAAAGVMVLALAIAVLGVAVWWKSKNHGVWVAPWAKTPPDAGAAIVVEAPALDAGEEEIVHTIEPVVLDAGGRRIVEHPAARDAAVEAVAIEVADAGESASPNPEVATSSSPFSPRVANGLPADLPEVDMSFDFDGFVTEKLATAETLEKDGDLVKLREVINDLLSRDPINATGKQMLTRLVQRETASDALTKAEAFYQKGELARALKMYATIPDDAPQAKEARAKIEELRSKAIDQELDHAEKDLKEKKTWKNAHRRFKDVLELDPASARALTGVRSVERKMRQKGVRFAAWVPPSSDTTVPKIDTPEEVDQAIAEFHNGDETLARISQLYQSGQIEKAMKKAEAAEKKAEGPKKSAVKKVASALKKVKAEAERAKNEMANDPSVAWTRLTALVAAENDLLPPSVKSVVRKDLEESISETFATNGTHLFDTGNYEGAFERWSSGLQLDKANPVILAGLKRLEEKAKQDLESAEHAAQRGERDACQRMKNISKITQQSSEVYQRALLRARQVCG